MLFLILIDLSMMIMHIFRQDEIKVHISDIFTPALNSFAYVLKFEFFLFY
jgi:hypothetical protein